MTPNLFKPLTFAIGFAIASIGVAAEMDSSLKPAEFDQKVGACQNLFTYVNANWINAHPIPSDRTSWGSFEMLEEQSLAAQQTIVEDAAKGKNKPGSLEQKIGDFYATGMDEGAIEKSGYDPIRADLKRIDGLKSADAIAAFLRDSAVQGNSYVFGFGSNPDFKNSSLMIGYAGQGGLGLPERDYYLKTDDASKKLRDAYVAYIARTLELVGVSKDDAAKQASSTLDFETRIAKASLPIVEMRKPENRYHPVSVAEADAATPHFSWTKFLAAQHVPADKFSLSQPQFFAEIDRMLGDVPADQWRGYLRFHVVNGAAPFLSKAFVDANFDFYSKTLRGQTDQKPRWKRVLNTVDREMGMALGQLYVAKNFSPESKARAQELVSNLRVSLKARIEKLDWMSDETKVKALEKWSSFNPKIGYPDEWRDWTGLSISRGSYFANVRAAEKFDHDWRLGKIGKPVDRKEWGMTPQTINAYYNPTKNEIVFPAAILQPPFFDAKADDALNYGGIGAVIGHEMTHGYDDQGSQFDALGNLQNWWTDADKKQFESRTDKLVKQFDDYVAIDDLHVHGRQTLGENIADLGGLNVAFDAMQQALSAEHKKPGDKFDGYTENQRFFLNFARVWARSFKPEELKLRLNTDVHAPAQFRAIAAPSNMPVFAEAFGCKAGDAMLRADAERVKIW
jgi:putative endopeptidase